MEKILTEVEAYYTEKVLKFGATPKGVDWRDEASQLLRFKQLMKLIDMDGNSHFEIADLGCGYGKLLEYLEQNYKTFSYTGYDLSSEMIREAKEKFRENFEFKEINKTGEIQQAEFIIASGIFNVKMDVSASEWKDYILGTLDIMGEKCKKGFACNFLTLYSDKELMRNDLFYADPGELLHFCKTRISKYVSIIHDYPLYEFSVIVRKKV